MTNKKTPIALIILDGFGYSETDKYNAISQAKKPNWDKYWQQYSHTFISGSGNDVGLPDGQMGNSEVGHLNIGAGRMVPQDLTKVELAIKSGEFFENKVFLSGIDKAKNNNKAVHVLGLLSSGGVHSHEDQILAFCKLAHDHGIEKLYLHAFLDGRDTPPQSAQASLDKVEEQGYAKIASLTGRYYAMDRDKRWDRVEAAYNLLTIGETDFSYPNATAGLEAAYSRNETDEFAKPTAITQDQPITIEDGDVVVFMNFRADRAREITQAFTDNDFDGFARKKKIDLGAYITLTQYHKDFPVDVAYPPVELKNILGEYLANNGLTQLRIAETEKYAHVTFFFNGGVEQPFEGEDRILIPSPDVATYDLQPEMSAPELTDKLVAAIESNKYDVIICNYANPDMVGHTGNQDAAIKAIEAIDTCLGRVFASLEKAGGEALVTADHGNAECMFNEETGQPHTAHTSNLVPLLYVGREAKIINEHGKLCDLAPSILKLMGLEQPKEMTGKPIFEIFLKE